MSLPIELVSTGKLRGDIHLSDGSLISSGSPTKVNFLTAEVIDYILKGYINIIKPANLTVSQTGDMATDINNLFFICENLLKMLLPSVNSLENQNDSGNIIDNQYAYTFGWLDIDDTPTTISGYGIVDALSNSISSTQSGYFGDLYLYDDTSPSNYLQITNSSNLTTTRVLAININDSNRILDMLGDLTVSETAEVSGTNTGDQTITLSGDITGTGTDSITTTLSEKWDDLRFPASGINPAGSAAPPDIDNILGGLLFSASTEEIVSCLVQLPHSYKAGSTLKPHVHWTKTNTNSGNVVWQIKYKWAVIGKNIDADWTILSAFTPIATIDDPATDIVHMITPLGEILGTDKKISDMLIFQLSRLPENINDTYGSDARLLEFDVHMLSDAVGSTAEFIK